MNEKAIHPIIYVRGYAMTQTEIEDTVADPYMGFNVGSCKVRQLWDGKVKKFFFESPLVRLMKEYRYDDVYVDGADQIEEDYQATDPVPYRSVVIYRYYEPSSKDLGTGVKPNMQRFATGLGDLILRLRDRMFPDGKPLEDGRKPSDFRVYLVAHSMGGLVCRAFLQNPAWSEPATRKLVDKVFTYATPHNGIEMAGFNVPSWMGLYGMNTFSRGEMAKFLALKKADQPPGSDAVDIVTGFDYDRLFNLVGTNPADYQVAGGLSSFGAGETSDGLVRIENATTRGWDGNRLESSPQAFVHRSHSGYYGIVNSEEGYQNLTRFLYGEVRADGYLDIDELTLPKAVQKAYDAGKDIKASYLFESVVSIRGKQWQLHRRTANENSAIFRMFDDLFPKKKAGARKPEAASPLLFNVFLDPAQSRKAGTVSFSADIRVRVPDYTIDGFLFLDEHYEGSNIFRDMVILEAAPPVDAKSDWVITYRFESEKDAPPKPVKILKDTDDELTFGIPIVQPINPGIRATLRVVTRFWNNW